MAIRTPRTKIKDPSQETVAAFVEQYKSMGALGCSLHLALRATEVEMNEEGKFLMMALNTKALDIYSEAPYLCPTVRSQLLGYIGEAQARFGFFPGAS